MRSARGPATRADEAEAEKLGQGEESKRRRKSFPSFEGILVIQKLPNALFRNLTAA